jgi:type VI secretion system ImpC/EvpB family protein
MSPVAEQRNSSGEWVRFAGGERARPVAESGAFAVGVIANLSACTGCRRWRERLAARFVDVDRDSLGDLLAGAAPQLELDGGEPFAIGAFEHFSPDALAARIPSLAKLLEARDRVGDTERVRRLLEEVDARVALDEKPGPPPVSVAERTGAGQQPNETELLNSLLDAPASDEPTRFLQASADPAFDRIVREIADASADRTDHARLDRWRAAIDAELSHRVRAVLRHPRFQALEASWRALRDLVFHAEGGEGIRLRVLDVAREDLLGELEAGLAPEATTLHRLVYEREHGTPGGVPFRLLLADFVFEATDDDARVLRHLAQVAAASEAPLLAGAGRSLWEPALRGEAADGAAWKELRAAPESRWIALACPGVLARLPYGRATEPCERFTFEEEATADTPERYVWSNAGFLVARAILASVAATGSPAEAARFGRIESLPFHAHALRGENVGFGPTERVWTDREVERLMAAGLTPLRGARGGDFVQVNAPSSIGRAGMLFGA